MTKLEEAVVLLAQARDMYETRLQRVDAVLKVAVSQDPSALDAAQKIQASYFGLPSVSPAQDLMAFVNTQPGPATVQQQAPKAADDAYEIPRVMKKKGDIEER